MLKVVDPYYVKDSWQKSQLANQIVDSRNSDYMWEYNIALAFQ